MKTKISRLRFPLLAAMPVFLYGCATPSTMLVNPSTGELTQCYASGWGWAGAPMAQISHNKCVENLEKVGYKKVDEVTPAILEIRSAPSGATIYAGSTEGQLERIGVTPFSQTHPNNTRMWARECYQVKREGYAPSEIKCYNQKWGDRFVSFDLEES